MFVARMGHQHEHVIIRHTAGMSRALLAFVAVPSDGRKMCVKLHAGEEWILTSSETSRDKSNFELCLYLGMLGAP